MKTEYAARRKLLVLLFAVNGRMTAAQKAVLIEKAIRNKVESVCEVTDNLAYYFPTDVTNAHAEYMQEIDGAIKTLFKRGSKLATAKGQLEFILGFLERLLRQRTPHDKDDSLENACHYIYRHLNDYLQFSTRDARIWHAHPVGDAWVSDDKLTMVYTMMCLPGHYFNDEIKLTLMTLALRPEIVDFDGFLRLAVTVAEPAIVRDWVFRTQRLLPVSELDTRRNIRCLPRQDKLAGLASYLMREQATGPQSKHRLVESVINSLPNRISITGPEMKVWVSEINKLAKNQKKVPAEVNLIETKKEISMSEIFYPLRRRMVATVLSTIHPSTACAELLAAMANNQMNAPVEVGTYVCTHMKGPTDLMAALSVKHDSIDDIKDDDQQGILRLMTEIHNLGHMPGMDGNSYHAKFLAIYEGYLGISQRIHDAFYNPKKESPMNKVNPYLPLLAAVVDPRFFAPFPAVQVLGLLNRICDFHPIDKIVVEDELAKFGCSVDFIKQYREKLNGTLFEAQHPDYRAKALRSIAYYLNSIENMPKAIVDAKGLSDLVAKIQKTLQVTELERAEWKVGGGLLGEQFSRFSEASNAIQPSFGQQPYFRSGFDVSHDAIPYKAPSDALAGIMNQAFINDPTRAMRTIIALQEAAAAMGLTDEQLPGGFSYLFRHGAVSSMLRIPNCEREVTAQELVEHHVYWTVLLAVQAQAAQSNFNGLRLMNEEQIKTILAYIGSTEKRETLIRLL